MSSWQEDNWTPEDAQHGRGYLIDPEKDIRRTSDDGLADAAVASLLGIWFALPIIKSVIRWMVYVAIIILALWFIP